MRSLYIAATCIGVETLSSAQDRIWQISALVDSGNLLAGPPMSRFGVWQCARLSLNLCKWGGSSRGARKFQEKFWPDFKAENPQLEVAELIKPGKHPFLEARYKNGNVRAVDVKNKDEEEILRLAYLLRSAAGRTTHKKLRRHVLPKLKLENGESIESSPSVQGRWQAGMFPPVHELRPTS